MLAVELGIEPSPPLRELNNRILAQDPTLTGNHRHRVDCLAPRTTTQLRATNATRPPAVAPDASTGG